MSRELAVAVPTAALLGLLAFTGTTYAFWRTWAATRFSYGMSGYVAMNAAAGALGVLLASLLSWEPFPEKWVLQGILFAAVGQGLLRVEPRGFGLAQVNEARSLLERGVRWILGWVDHGVATAIQNRLGDLDDRKLFNLALYLHGRWIAGDEAIARESKDLLKAGLIDAGGLLGGPQSAEGRGRLEEFCARQITERQLAPPTFM